MKWTLAKRNHVFYELASAAGPGIPSWFEVRQAIGYRMGCWPSLYVRSQDDLAGIATELPWIDAASDSDHETVDDTEALEGIGATWGFVAPHGADSSLWQVRVGGRLVLSVRTSLAAWPTYVAVATLARTGFARKLAAYRDRMWQEHGLSAFLEKLCADPKEAGYVSESAERHVADIRTRIDKLRAALPAAEAAAARWKDAVLAAESEVRLRADVASVRA